jgi:polyferredoxin
MAGRFRTAFKDAFKVVHTLALEVLGAFFLALFFIGAGSVVQEYKTYTDSPEFGVWRLGLAGVFSLAMLAFGAHSFWKARKIRK